MQQLRERLAALARALGVQKPLLARARRRTKADHRRALEAEAQRDSARTAADLVRAEGHLRKARRKDRKAARLDHRALKMHRRAAHWAGRVKVLHARVEGIESSIAGLEAEIRELEARHRVKIDQQANKVSGGNPGKRFLATWATMVANCANGTRRNFYSQAGGPDIRHELRPGPAYGCRSDCSSSITGSCWTAELPDPNGLRYSGQGYTGTLIGEHGGWHETTLEGLLSKGWGYIVYGEGPGFHVEAYTPSESDRYRTSGHGDAAVNHGTVHLFGSGTTERYYVLN